MLFLAGVANATILDGDKLIANATTLLDSSITIGVTLEDIRAGQGAKLFGRYAHTSTFGLKITDAMFSLDYLAMNTGSDVTFGGDVIHNEKLTAGADKKLTLTKTAIPFGNAKTVKAYIFQAGSDANYVGYDVAEDNTVTAPAAGEYCVRYMYNNTNASRIVINSNFIPSTVTVILEANLFNGGSCDVSTSTLAGKLTIKVPRFMLSGNVELSMTATGVSQTSLEGQALSSGCEGCDGDGVYAEIIQVLEAETWQSKAAGLMYEDNYQEVTAGSTVNITPVLYAYFNDRAPMVVPADATVTASLDAGTTTLTYNNGVISGTAVAGTAVLKAKVEGIAGEAALTIVVA